MEIHVEECKGLRRASASIRDHGVIAVKVPRHWPKDTKREVISRLVGRIERKNSREKLLLAKQAAKQPTISLRNQAELEAYVSRINAETFNVPLGKIRLGYARYNHLAQVNLRTKTMTVSKYCLHEAPAEALRYLIIHELAHYYEAGHGPRFWALVGRHVDNYRLQSRIIKAFHHQAVIREGLDDALPDADETDEEETVAETPPAPRRKSNSAASRPVPTHRRTPASKNQPKQKPAEPSGKSGFDWFRQLILWGDR